MKGLLESLTHAATRAEELAMAAEYLARTGRVSLAKPLADRAVDEDPDAANAHVASAFVAFTDGRTDEAIFEQTRAIELAGPAGAKLAPALARYVGVRKAASVGPAPAQADPSTASAPPAR